MDIRLLDYQSTTAAGQNIHQLRVAIDSQASGLRLNDLDRSDIDTWIGRVSGIEDIDLGPWQSRNNALAALGYQQGSIQENIDKLVSLYGAARLGVVMGSSTSSIDRTESAYLELEDGQLSSEYQQPQVHNPNAPSLFMTHLSGIRGPSMTINTACSSSAKVFATGARWLESGVVDAVLVGGVDTLCLSVLHGFDSLQLVAKNQCMPLDQNRDGINLGEASGFAILVKPDEKHQDSGITLLGYGESSDAYHMSHPHPEGLGARLSMQQALTMANLNASQIDYINLHGTSSRANDLIEGKLIESMFSSNTQVSSTKAWMGHTLGAAGITEALIAADALQRGVIPGSLNLNVLDHELSLSVQSANMSRNMNFVMSNSFGFGGNNCTLAFGKSGEKT